MNMLLRLTHIVNEIQNWEQNKLLVAEVEMLRKELGLTSEPAPKKEKVKETSTSLKFAKVGRATTAQVAIVMHAAVELKNRRKAKEIEIRDSQTLLEFLVKLYHQTPTPHFEVYHQGVQAGIRYALLATNQHVPGISLKGGEGK